jgi:TonB family protein
LKYLLITAAIILSGVSTFAWAQTESQPASEPKLGAVSETRSAPPTESTMQEVFFDSDPKSWARVKRIVAPKYPEDAVKNGIGGTVDIEVLIDRLGGVKEIRSLKSNPNNPQFEEATRLVLGRWLFNASRTHRCVPYETVGEARLTFEVKHGEGVISLTHRPRSVPPPLFVAQRAPIKALNRAELQKVFSEAFPQSARREGAQANLYALLTIDANTGTVLNAEVTHVIAPKDFEKAFAKAAMEGLLKVKYPPLPNRAESWKTCFDITYRLSGHE